MLTTRKCHAASILVWRPTFPTNCSRLKIASLAVITGNVSTCSYKRTTCRQNCRFPNQQKRGKKNNTYWYKGVLKHLLSNFAMMHVLPIHPWGILNHANSELFFQTVCDTFISCDLFFLSFESLCRYYFQGFATHNDLRAQVMSCHCM